MKINNLIVSGRIAEDATIVSASPKSDIINIRIISNDFVNGKEVPVQHRITQLVSKGKGNAFAEQYLKKGRAITAQGRYRKTISKSENQTYINHSIDTSFGGSIHLNNNEAHINKASISGFLSDDAKLVNGPNNDFLILSIITEGGQKDAPVEVKVVKFGKRGEFDKIITLLKKGAGVFANGFLQYSKNEAENGKTYYNAQVIASEKLSIFQYAKTPSKVSHDEKDNQASNGDTPPEGMYQDLGAIDSKLLEEELDRLMQA